MPKAKVAPDVEIYYEVEGEGAPLLLLSGTGYDHTFWSGQLPAFRREYRCIVLDNRGVGQSSVPPPGYRLADMADDAVGVLDALGVERSHVMGLSMGGHIAQEICLRHPGRVLSLGVHHTWARNCPRLDSFQRIRRRIAMSGDREVLADLTILGLYAHDYYDEHPSEIAKRRDWLMQHSPTDAGWIGQLEACLKGDTYDRLPEIRVPTLVTASDHDLVVDPHHAREIHDRIPGSRLVILEGSGHLILIERPEAFAAVCLEFLRSLDGRSLA